MSGKIIKAHIVFKNDEMLGGYTDEQEAIEVTNKLRKEAPKDEHGLPNDMCWYHYKDVDIRVSESPEKNHKPLYKFAKPTEDQAAEPIEDKRLTVARCYYGVSEIPVIMLNYHNGGAYPTFEILNGQISMTVLDSITLALQAGYKIDYVSYPRPSEAKKRQESKTVGDPLEDEISRGITK